MALFDPNSTSLQQNPVFDYQANKDNIDLQRKLAQGMINAPINSGQMVDGWYAPTSTGSQLAQALSKIAGGAMMGMANKNATGLATQDANSVDATTGYNPAGAFSSGANTNTYAPSAQSYDPSNWMSSSGSVDGSAPQFNMNTPNAVGVFKGAAQQPGANWLGTTGDMTGVTTPQGLAAGLQSYLLNSGGGSGNSSGQQDSNASSAGSPSTGSVPTQADTSASSLVDPTASATPVNPPSQLKLPAQPTKEEQAKQNEAQFWHDVTRLAYSGPAGRLLADNMIQRKNAMEDAMIRIATYRPEAKPITVGGDTVGFYDPLTRASTDLAGQPFGSGQLPVNVDRAAKYRAAVTQAFQGIDYTNPNAVAAARQSLQQQGVPEQFLPPLNSTPQQMQQVVNAGKTATEQQTEQKNALERAGKQAEIGTTVAGLDNSIRDTNRLLSLTQKYGTGGLNNIANGAESLGGIVGINPERRAEIQEMQTLFNQGTFHTAIGLLNGAGRLGQAEFKAINDHSMTPSTDLSTAANINILKRQLQFLQAKKDAALQEQNAYNNAQNAASGAPTAPAPVTTNGQPAGYKQRYQAPSGGVPKI